MRQLISRLFKFGIVGSLGTVIDFSVTALMMVITGHGEYISQSVLELSVKTDASVVAGILFANLVGFVFAVTSNYLLNRIWTWRSTDPGIKRQYARFLAVSVAGLAINLTVIFVFNVYISLEFMVAGFLVTRFWIAKVTATAVVMLWNFIMNNIYTFKTKLIP